jgi:putative FmdB family regulatory protein
MPIYEYHCSKCGRIQEVMQKFSDKPLTKCQECSGKLSKMISNCTFHLKGSGWYVTDYKKGSSTWQDKPAAEKKSETPKTEPAAPAVESKPAEKKE